MFERKFINYLHGGHYSRAKALAKNILFEELYNILLRMSFENDSLIPYSFFVFMLFDKETAQLHHAASVIMSTALSHYTGAFSVGLLHARKAAALEPTTLRYQEWLLSFYDIPEQVISDDEISIIANYILEGSPNNTNALKVLESILQKKSQKPKM